MSAYVGTFDPRPAWNESLKGPFVRSLMLHLAIAGGASVYAWLSGVIKLGAPDAGGNVVGVEIVNEIPLPSSSQRNPVANDTQSTAPPPPAPKAAPKAAPERPEKGIAIEKSKKAPPPAQPKLKSFTELASNQVTSRTLPKMGDPMFAVKGSGQIGISENTTLGTRLPGYATALRNIVQGKWRTDDVAASIKTAPRVTISFVLMRDGTVKNVRLTRRSGVPALDFSVERAIQLSLPFPRIPPEYEGDSIDVDFSFDLRR